MRDYTPRAFDAAGNRLTIDFALHDAGPATAWALNARPGETLLIGGPRGSTVVPDDFDFYLLAGDETALPSIGRRLESPASGRRRDERGRRRRAGGDPAFGDGGRLEPDVGFSRGRARRRRHASAPGSGALANASRRGLRMGRRRGPDRPRFAQLFAGRARLAQGLVQGGRLLGARRGGGDRKIRRAERLGAAPVTERPFPFD